jgi:hypothetical protein
MTAPAIGSITPASMTMLASSSTQKTTRFNQFGADGVGLIVGSFAQKSCKIRSTHYVADQNAAYAIKSAAADMAGTLVSITRDDVLGSSITTANVAIEDVVVLEDKACAGLPGGNSWKLVLEWDALFPVSY